MSMTDGANCYTASTRMVPYATAQVRKDTPSLIGVENLGRPKAFTGREEDFQQWSQKTEAFFAGVIKESAMVLDGVVS